MQTNSINGMGHTLPNAGSALAFDFDSATGNGALGSGAVLGTAPQNEAMICFGDSGGPAFAGNAFAGGSLTVIGATIFSAFRIRTTIPGTLRRAATMRLPRASAISVETPT
ncbi:MAG TPA: hypothetical protein VKG25_28735 [Bryobacteraceae bacterium]|nr:hypothetical protein [Bryobacteraceae bacterium]